MKVWFPITCPAFDQFTNNVRALLDVTADQEKCGVNIVPGQDFQQTQSMRIVGPVIVSERQLFRAAARAR